MHETKILPPSFSSLQLNTDCDTYCLPNYLTIVLYAHTALALKSVYTLSVNFDVSYVLVL
jgi:hypothetical protein